MKFQRFILIRLFLLLFCADLARAQTTKFIIVTNDSALGAMLQIQEQLHATRLQMEGNRAAAAADAQKNSDALSARLQLLEQAVQNQRALEADAARKTQQLTLMLAGVFGLIGLGVMLLMIYFQWRAFRITVTGVLNEASQDRLARIVFHDVAGWLMMPLALAILFFELHVLGRAIVARPGSRSGRSGFVGSTL